jgi:hypothetical protein
MTDESFLNSLVSLVNVFADDQATAFRCSKTSRKNLAHAIDLLREERWKECVAALRADVRAKLNEDVHAGMLASPSHRRVSSMKYDAAPYDWHGSDIGELTFIKRLDEVIGLTVFEEYRCIIGNFVLVIAFIEFAKNHVAMKALDGTLAKATFDAFRRMCDDDVC